MYSDEFVYRFWSKVEKTDDCWLWIAGTDKNGYGLIKLDGRSLRAHRISWMLKNNQLIPNQMFVCHSCDNPSCVNPAHLWLGTAQDNARDRDVKGRHGFGRVGATYRGQDHHQAKLTKEAVLEIRSCKSKTQRLLAQEYGVSEATISLIKSRKIWTHI